MIRQYMEKAMGRAQYEILPDGEGYYGEIPDCPGVYANAPSLEECRKELEEVLEEWILLRINRNLAIPPVDGIEIIIRKEGVA